MIGTRLLPVAVNSYSTLIGTSGKTVRFTSPSASNICSVLDNTLVDISGICLANWLKRVEPCPLITITCNDIPNRANLNDRFFFFFFRHDNLLFFCISNLRVTLIHICNFLYCKQLIHIFAVSKRKQSSNAKLVNLRYVINRSINIKIKSYETD